MSAKPALRPAAGRLLVATPELSDPNFTHTVVLLLAVQSEGALGIVLNRPSDRRVADVLPQWADRVASPTVVFLGGPVGLDSVIGLSAVGTINLNDPDETAGDDMFRLFAGSAGWGSGQLEAEIDQGAWWVFETLPDDMTTPDPSGLWPQVLRRQSGITAWFALATADPSFN